jgi:hypothetical protein
VEPGPRPFQRTPKRQVAPSAVPLGSGDPHEREGVIDTKPRIEPALVEEFVGIAHGDLDAVIALLAEHPTLVNAAWDWGGGDWETGLGAAAHMGRRDIALPLLGAGARLDLFAAAMLGSLDVVRAAVDADPETVHVPGPHGIPLIAHAEAGGEQAAEVLAFLRSRM